MRSTTVDHVPYLKSTQPCCVKIQAYPERICLGWTTSSICWPQLLGQAAGLQIMSTCLFGIMTRYCRKQHAVSTYESANNLQKRQARTHCNHERLEVKPHRQQHQKRCQADEQAALQTDAHHLVMPCAIRLSITESVSAGWNAMRKQH